jgi:hypothetical protein
MRFDKNINGTSVGKCVGYLFAYLIFSFSLYFILVLTKREMKIYYIMAIAFCIAGFGLLVKRLLK